MIFRFMLYWFHESEYEGSMTGHFTQNKIEGLGYECRTIAHSEKESE